MSDFLSTLLRIAQAQINVTVGDVDGNLQQILATMERARSAGAHLVSFPELSLCGYPPEDLLFHPRFVDANRKALRQIAGASGDLVVVVGLIDRGPGGVLHNGAAVLHGGGLIDIYHKGRLPNYGVFDEQRYFSPGNRIPIYRLGPIRFSVSICEDIWANPGPVHAQTRMGGAQVVVNINASPFDVHKRSRREAMLMQRAKETGAFICYTNLVGGQDELVFDGQSLVISPDGTELARGAAFAEDLIIADLDTSQATPEEPHRRKNNPPDTPGALAVEAIEIAATLDPPTPALPDRPQVLPPSANQEIFGALVLGVRDYLHKSGFTQAVIGLSGGIDSALVAAIAADALGADNVTCVYMPSRYSSDDSQNDARQLADNLGVAYQELAIEGPFKALLSLLADNFAGTEPNEAEENLQSRIRGNLLMALSNKFGYMVLTTGNKSEMSVGYATLYGDMAGGFAVIKDLSKLRVYEISHHINEQAGREIIPANILSKPPTAELRPDQLDTDSLPPYEVLDPILEAYVEQSTPIDDIIAQGFDKTTVRRVIRLVDRAEYKRRQAPPGVRISPRAFGRDRRMPITNRFSE